MFDNRKILDPLQINDWNFKTFICIVLSVQLAAMGSIGLDLIGIHFPILRQLTCFIYLTFIPGIIILRILKLHKLGSAETLLYSVGLSLFFLMFTGFLMNIFYPLFGINRPLSVIPLMMTINSIILLLCIFSCNDKNFSSESHPFIKISDILSPYVLFMCLLPFLSIFGTYLVNFYNQNILLIALLLIISFISILMAFYQVPRNTLLFSIMAISISLLYHRSLISTNLWGWDIHNEFFYSNLVINNSFWDSNIFSNVNSLLSINILAPIYSIICNLNLTWVFKIIFPLLFSLVPLGLYLIFEKQTDERISFLSVFFFMSIFSFYGELPVLARQEIAELFLVLLILLMSSTYITDYKISVLFLLFSISLVVSHYAVTFIFIFLLVSFWITTIFIDKFRLDQLLINSFNAYRPKRIPTLQSSVNENKSYFIITSNYILIVLVFTFGWYLYTSASAPFRSITLVLNAVCNHILTDFLDPNTVQGSKILVMGTTSLVYTILKYLHIITQFFILIGVSKLLISYNEMRFKKEYSILSIISLIICFACITVPYFAYSITVTRLYHIALFFLSPFCIIGGIIFFRPFVDALNKSKINSTKNTLKLLSIFFAFFLLFNSGFMHEIIGPNSQSISLNSTLDYTRFNDGEIKGADWAMKVNNTKVYGDEFGKVLLGQYVPDSWNIGIFNGDTNQIPSNSLIYLRTLISRGTIVVPARKLSYEKSFDYIPLNDSLFYSNVLVKRNKIYCNSYSEVYR